MTTQKLSNSSEVVRPCGPASYVIPGPTSNYILSTPASVTSLSYSLSLKSTYQNPDN